MRTGSASLLLLIVAACTEHGSRPNGGAPDAGFISDAGQQFCSAPAGSANVTVTAATTATFSRLHAGGIWATGPFAFASPPMTVDLVFTSADPLDGTAAQCCNASDKACCGVDGVVAHSIGALAAGAELGAHPVTVTDTAGTFNVNGTMTITNFVQPFEHAPGRIAGSITSSSGGRSIDGSFDNAFCALLLSQTI